DVAGLVDGGAADVHADVAGADGLEVLLLAGQRVVDAQGHWRILQGLSGRTRAIAWQAMASARPMWPTRSPVLALTLTASALTPSSSARLRRMAPFSGPNFGS